MCLKQIYEFRKAQNFIPNFTLTFILASVLWTVSFPKPWNPVRFNAVYGYDIRNIIPVRSILTYVSVNHLPWHDSLVRNLFIPSWRGDYGLPPLDWEVLSTGLGCRGVAPCPWARQFACMCTLSNQDWMGTWLDSDCSRVWIGTCTLKMAAGLYASPAGGGSWYWDEQVI